MRKLTLSALLFLIALNALGHAGEVHKYMGTIESVAQDGSFVLTKKDGEAITVAVSNKTVYLFANGASATAAEVKAGRRAVVTISTDGKTASEVKLPAKK